MDTWQMPMFFFLSGVSAYYALFRRSEKQFREERAHRLFVPWLVLCLLNGVYCITWVAPLTPNCEAAKSGDKVNSSVSGMVWSHCENYQVITVNTTFSQYLLDHYAGPPNAGQGWFLMYLFFYSQVLCRWLCMWHPSHVTHHSCSSSVLGCHCFFFRLARNHAELVASVMWWLGSPVRLLLCPVMAIALPEIVRPFTPNYLSTLVLDWSNNFNYCFIFLFGYAITAADQAGMKEVKRKGRWFYLAFGLLIAIPFTFDWKLDSEIPKEYDVLYKICKGILGASGEWGMVLGLTSVTRELVTTQYRYLPVLSQLAMPFYLTHQQVLVTVLSLSLSTPVLGSFPIVLILTTITTTTLSFIIVKLGPLRYWFGLPPTKGSAMPGTTLRGFLPLTVLSVAVIIVQSLQFLPL